MQKEVLKIVAVTFLVLVFSCKGKEDKNTPLKRHQEAILAYHDLQERELATEVMADSVFYGVHLKMTSTNFFEHCQGMLEKGIFDGNYNNEVIVALDKGFKKKVKLVFYPKFNKPFIESVQARFSYMNSSVFNRKEEGSAVLMEELKKVLLQWYGGNPFIAIPPKNAFDRPIYVKIDGNREITLKEDGSLKEVIAIYTDLKPLF
ncbi:hypothetical protein [Flagellimonas sp.]|uniref:hypothetical protein n=1 Tax=Flagellimonas sp. TaxID=2058762 RepID=UPI003BA86427